MGSASATTHRPEARDIQFRCPACSQPLVVDRTGAGLVVDCPACGAPAQIPGTPRKGGLKRKGTVRRVPPPPPPPDPPPPPNPPAPPAPVANTPPAAVRLQPAAKARTHSHVPDQPPKPEVPQSPQPAAEVEALQAEVGSLSKAVQALAAEKAALESALAAAESRPRTQAGPDEIRATEEAGRAQAAARIAELEGLLRGADERFKKSLADLEESRHQAAALRAEASEARARVAAVAADLDAARRTADDARRETEKARASADAAGRSAANDLRVVRDDRDRANSEVERLRGDLARARGEVDQLRRRLADVEPERRHMAQEQLRFEKALDASRFRAESLQHDLDAARERIAQMSDNELAKANEVLRGIVDRMNQEQRRREVALAEETRELARMRFALRFLGWTATLLACALVAALGYLAWLLFAPNLR